MGWKRQPARAVDLIVTDKTDIWIYKPADNQVVKTAWDAWRRTQDQNFSGILDFGNYAVTANFSLRTYTVAATVAPPGSGSVAGTGTFIRDGRLRGLATTGEKRARAMPDLPTLAEAGLAGYSAYVWMGLLAPKATPAASKRPMSPVRYTVPSNTSAVFSASPQ